VASLLPPCTSPCTGPGSVAAAAYGVSRWAGPSGGGPACAGASELDCAASRGWKRDRRVVAGGPSEEGRCLAAACLGGAPPAGPPGWNCCSSRLRSDFPGGLPRGSVSVWRCAVMSCAPGSASRGASGPGGPAVGGVLAGSEGECVPAKTPGSPAGRPMSSTWGLASDPCPPGGTRDGPVGATTAWGTGCTAWSTAGIGGRATPGQ